MEPKSFADVTFVGLSNKKGITRKRSNELEEAYNLEISDDGEIRTRKGLTRKVALTGITAAYFRQDQSCMYVVAEGTLYRIYPDFTTKIIATGIDGTDLYWAEFGNRVAISGSEFGVIREESNTFVSYPLARPLAPVVAVNEGGSLPAGEYQVAVVELVRGEQSPASAITTVTLEAPGFLNIATRPNPEASLINVYVSEPNGSVLYLLGAVEPDGTFYYNGGLSLVSHLPEDLLNSSAFPDQNGPCAIYQGQLFASLYEAQHDTTYLYPSRPLRYGIYDIVRSFVPVPGRVTLLHGTPDGLLIGTDRGIYVYAGALGKISQLPVPTHHAAAVDKEGKAWFWTRSGLASALPLELVTADRLDPDSSAKVSLGFVEADKGDKIIAITKD